MIQVTSSLLHDCGVNRVLIPLKEMDTIRAGDNTDNVFPQ